MFYAKLKLMIGKFEYLRRTPDVTLLNFIKLRNAEAREGKLKDERELDEEKLDPYWQVNIGIALNLLNE